MFPRKKPEPPKRRSHDLSQFGLIDIPDDFDPSAGYGDVGSGDSDLEAELAAITNENNKTKRKPKANLVPAAELDKMIADSMKDIGSDDDDDDDDAIDNDPDLLGELQTIAGDENVEPEASSPLENNVSEVSPPQELFLPTSTLDTIDIIKQRIEMYKQAESHAKTIGETSKARRFGRGLKTLFDLLKQAQAGKSINIDDMPPEVSIKGPAAGPPTNPIISLSADELPKVPTRVAPPPPQEMEVTETMTVENPVSSNPLLDQLRSRQQEYKIAALQAKRDGDTPTAIQFLKVVKQFDMVIKLSEDKQEVDLSDMPPPPAEFKEFLATMQVAADEKSSQPTPVVEPTPLVSTAPEVEPVVTTPSSIIEALQERLEKYKSVEEAAKAEGNSSKARRFGRIVKQYEDAIKSHKAGRPVAYEELPVPPGYGPLPSPDQAPQPPPATKAATPSSDITTNPSADTVAPRRPAAEKQELTTRISGNQQKNNLAEQQMKILLERQKEFKLAAIEAKKAGEIDQAKEYLKIFKGFDSLLTAASSGLPVDLTSLPLPPSQRENLEASFAIVTTDDCDPNDDIADIGIRIEEQLAKQLMMCKNTRDHHKAMGDIPGMNRFENLALQVQKDLDLVRFSKRKNFPIPQFHYEKKSFNIVHCNTDLTDNELEIVVVRGMNYSVANPKEVDTYVKVDFPLLNDEAFKAKTSVVKDTENPDYDQRFKIEIQRNNRLFLRLFKRHSVKFDVLSRGGFLRSDTQIGSVTVKLQPLETKCDIHDTFNLMDGRKVVGKLEVKIRVRNPMLTKQMEHINEKWLVLDA